MTPCEQKVTGQSWRHTLFVLVMAFLPLALFWVCVYVVWPWYWYDCFDPEGIHFAAGLSILHGHGPGNVDNPATPLQLLSAILCWATNCTILDLEKFRPYAYSTLILMRVATACLLVRTLLKGLPVTWQIALLWLPWLAPDFSMMSRQWCPEALYFPLGLAAVVAIDRSFKHPQRWQYAFIAGAAIGVMIGVKLIFVAWAAAAFAAIAISQPGKTSVRNLAALSGGSMAGFLVATLPACSRYPRMFEWIVGLASKTGQYGSGPTGFLNLDQAGANLMEVLLHQKVWTSLILLVAIGLLIRKSRSGIAIFCVMAILASYVLALKHFAPRYLAPTGLILVLASVEWLKNQKLAQFRWTGPAALVVVGALLGKSIAFDLHLHRAFVAERRESELALQQFLAQQGRSSESTILYGWRAFVPSFAAHFMSQGERHIFDAEIDAAFPTEGLIVSWPDGLQFPTQKSNWDFIVLGREFTDAEGLKMLRRRYRSWDVSRYVVIRNVEVDAITLQVPRQESQ